MKSKSIRPFVSLQGVISAIEFYLYLSFRQVDKIIVRGDIRVNTATWIAIYLPLFMLLFVMLPQQYFVQKAIVLRRKRREGLVIMTNELIVKYLGKDCRISTGTYGINVAGRIIDIKDNWIEVETKRGNELVNAEYIQNIKIDAVK